MDSSQLKVIRVGAAVPKVTVGDPNNNLNEILSLMYNAYTQGVKVLTFPELSITGYTCGDLFNQSILFEETESVVKALMDATAGLDMMVVVGAPIRFDNQLFNCAIVLNDGKISGIVPKVYMPNYNEFYEKRWFTSGSELTDNKIIYCNQEVTIDTNILFKDRKTNAIIGIEICEDAWVPQPPSIQHCLQGANIILNLSASNEVTGKAEYRRSLVKHLSSSLISAYVYCSAAQSESTTDTVFSGHTIIAENGSILVESKFKEDILLIQDIDIEKLQNDRIKFNSYMNNYTANEQYYVSEFEFKKYDIDNLLRDIDSHPFVPKDNSKRKERCEEIFEIQSNALSQRLKKTGINKLVIGISGGLDSTLALLVAVETMKKTNLPIHNIIGVTMPGFGTTNQTHENAVTLMTELGITTYEVSIVNACLQHFKDIGHDPSIHDITYENVQARERTQILMDLANKHGALVLGTGDLSELALGWCTYNGDHMSMYGVNSGIPKTLVKYLVSWYASDTNNVSIQNCLNDIVNTIVSPELLPPDKDGKIQQSTEDSIGPYELHDFFLYNMMRFGYTPKKIFHYAQIAFKDKYTDKIILKWMEVFYKRFFSQQFKRNAIPDGVKIGSISLSPRADWRMPSDASYNLWISEINKLY